MDVLTGDDLFFGHIVGGSLYFFANILLLWKFHVMEMKEVSFIRQNFEKWKRLEEVVNRPAGFSPGELADVYVEITADLSFSRAHYPGSRITVYLNNLASGLHHVLHGRRRERYGRLVTFWTQEIPLLMYGARRELLYSFLVFVVSAGIGVVSVVHDDSFARLVLGHGYVDMTLRNIENGDPMGVYGQSAELPMFVRIAFNNIRVSFNAFVLGVFTGFGTGYFLFVNGVMVGVFQMFCFEHDVGMESVLALWLHGVFEISAIIVAGAAGFVLGNGWLFPGTYARGYAFRRGAGRGLKMIVGLVPVFLVAGFIESFLTRHTEYPVGVRLSVIVFSLLCVIYYYIVLPQLRHHGFSKKKD